MSVRSYPDYLITEVTPLNGSRLRYLHAEVLDRPAYIEDIEVGHRGVIMYQPDYDDRFHRLHTSTIRNIEIYSDCKQVTIDTRNTRYVLTRMNWDKDTFRCTYAFTQDEANKAVLKFIRESHRENSFQSPEQIKEFAEGFRDFVREMGYMPSCVNTILPMYFQMTNEKGWGELE